MVYQTISAYFKDDYADELTLELVFDDILGKDALASQPTLSRIFNCIDEDILIHLDDIDKSLWNTIYFIKFLEHILLDLDSTLFGTYGNQEGKSINFHYQIHGYHPLLCYDSLTGDLLKTELRDETFHRSNQADKFMGLSSCNTWKWVLKHIFVETVDSHPLSFIKPVRRMTIPMPSV